jgi:hypothetical protein
VMIYERAKPILERIRQTERRRAVLQKLRQEWRRSCRSTMPDEENSP